MFINEKRDLLQATRIQNEDTKIKQSKDNSSSVILEEEFNDYTDFEEFNSDEKHHSSTSTFIDNKIFTQKEGSKKMKDDVIMPFCDARKGEEKIPQGMTYKGKLISG